jgi:UDP-glucose 4-epimerase
MIPLTSEPPAPHRELKSILVTGGAGFIGSHLVECLVARGRRVTVVDDCSTGRLDNLTPVRHAVTMVEGELTDVLERGRLRLETFDAIFHFAGNPYVPWSVEDPRGDYNRNLRASFELLEALRSVSQPPLFVNTSSAAVYGNPVSMPIGESCPVMPISPYGVSKLAAEHYATIYSQQYGIPSVSLRLFSVYGPRQRKQVVYDLVRKLRTDPCRLVVHGDGSQERDFIYVTDLVRAVVTVAELCAGRGETYNVASGTSYTMSRLVEAVCEVCGVSPEVAYTGHVRPGDAQRWTVDTRVLEQTGFRPAVLLDEGLAAVRDWYDTWSPEPTESIAARQKAGTRD